MVKDKPTGFVAKCRCGSVMGAMDFERTERREASRILGKWLFDGYTVEPRFEKGWSVTLSVCKCA